MSASAVTGTLTRKFGNSSTYEEDKGTESLENTYQGILIVPVMFLRCGMNPFDVGRRRYLCYSILLLPWDEKCT